VGAKTEDAGTLKDTSAILKVRDVATMIEEEKIKEETMLATLVAQKVAQHLSAQSTPRFRPMGARPPAIGPASRWTPRKPALAAITWKPEEEDAQAAVANAQPATKRVSFGPAAAQPQPRPVMRERPCFVCGKLDHLVANCKDEVALAKWRANALARLARRPQQVTACVAVACDEVDECNLDAEETEMLTEILALADVDEEGYSHLCALCGMEEQEEAFRDGGSEDVPETRE